MAFSFGATEQALVISIAESAATAVIGFDVDVISVWSPKLQAEYRRLCFRREHYLPKTLSCCSNCY